MQKRHTDRTMYFHELENTSRKYYVDYVSSYVKLGPGSRVLEVGCGEGGNLVPFAQKGYYTKGVDIAECRIEQARENFREMGCRADFSCENFLDTPAPEDQEQLYDVILLHDVIEHVPMKTEFLSHMRTFLKKDGVAFVAFPAWRMPFGGHQQICRNAICSRLPFIHLLPKPAYRALLRLFGETPGIIDELMSIKDCRVSIRLFERLLTTCGYERIQRTLWLVNPHYEQKFGMKPRRLSDAGLGAVGYLRDFFSTSCWYILRAKCDRAS